MLKLNWKKNNNFPSETIAKGKCGYACHIVHYVYSVSAHEYEFILMYRGNTIAKEDEIKTLKEAKEIAESYVLEMVNAFNEE